MQINNSVYNHIYFICIFKKILIFLIEIQETNDIKYTSLSSPYIKVWAKGTIPRYANVPTCGLPFPLCGPLLPTCVGSPSDVVGFLFQFVWAF